MRWPYWQRVPPGGGVLVQPALGPLIEQAKGRIYADGVADGIEVALRLLLGEQKDGGVPYVGPLPPETRRWAEQALRRVDGGRREAHAIAGRLGLS